LLVAIGSIYTFLAEVGFSRNELNTTAMAANINRLSRLMKMSWDIQKTKSKTRSKALTAAWAICSNEEVTIKYLALRLNRNKEVKQRALNQMSIFTQ